MKFIHLSDLHLGKRVHYFSMVEDQRIILEQILEIVDDEQPDAVLIAGDVYDRTIPSAEAIGLLDDFLVALSKREIPVLLISGNHDSPDRLTFAARLMEKSKVHIAPVYNGNTAHVTFHDEYGAVTVWMLPFLKPVHARRCFPEETIETYTDAIDCAIRHMDLRENERNVLMTHQFVSGSNRCDSEELSVGGTDNVDPSVFAPFDYVALGHLHGPQNVMGDRIRYCGTPLKYSFSEIAHKKSVTVVELSEKNVHTIRTIPLIPKRDFLKLRGTYLEVSSRAYYQNLDRDSYIQVTLTDEDDVPDAMAKLRVIYPNLMLLTYDNRRTQSSDHLEGATMRDEQTPLDLFESFYHQQTAGTLSEQQRAYLTHVMETIWEEHT